MRDGDISRLQAALLSLSRQSAVASILDGDVRLERSAYFILSRIDEAGPQSIGQLADAFGLDVSTLNRQTASVARSGLVERIADPDGGVARKFVLTERGRERFEAERDRNETGLRAVVGTWTDTEVAQLASLVERLTAEIDVRRSPRPAGE